MWPCSILLANKEQVRLCTQMSLLFKITKLDLNFQMRLTADLELDVCYYNVKLSVWEPLIEPNLIKEGEYDPWTLKIQVGFSNF